MALDEECYKNRGEIFDFKENHIVLGTLNNAWQTGTSVRTTRLIYNLWNGYAGEDANERFEDSPSYYTPSEIINSVLAPYYAEALKLKFPIYY